MLEWGVLEKGWATQTRFSVTINHGKVIHFNFRLDCHRRKCQAKTDVGERTEGREEEGRVAGEDCPHREAGCTWRGGPQQLSRYLKCTTSFAVHVPGICMYLECTTHCTVCLPSNPGT